jgi:hypothetical protein
MGAPPSRVRPTQAELGANKVTITLCRYYPTCLGARQVPAKDQVTVLIAQVETHREAPTMSDTETGPQ